MSCRDWDAFNEINRYPLVLLPGRRAFMSLCALFAYPMRWTFLTDGISNGTEMKQKVNQISAGHSPNGNEVSVDRESSKWKVYIDVSIKILQALWQPVDVSFFCCSGIAAHCLNLDKMWVFNRLNVRYLACITSLCLSSLHSLSWLKRQDYIGVPQEHEFL